MTPLQKVWPVAILEDRYQGTYSHGAWIAVAHADQHGDVLAMVAAGDGPWGDDFEAADFWWTDKQRPWLAVGATPDEALAALITVLS